MRFEFATLSLAEVAKEGLSTTSSMFLGTNESSSTAQLYVNGSTSLTGSLDVSGDVTFNSSVTINTDGYILLPSGSTAERPSPAQDGMMRYNTTEVKFEGYVGGNWVYFVTGSYGG